MKRNRDRIGGDLVYCRTLLSFVCCCGFKVDVYVHAASELM